MKFSACGQRSFLLYKALAQFRLEYKKTYANSVWSPYKQHFGGG